MSLINQMLNDLEKRQRSLKVDLSGLHAMYHSEQKKSRLSWLIVGLFIVCLLIWLFVSTHKTSLPITQKISSQLVDTSVPSLTRSTSIVLQNTLPGMLTGVTLQAESNVTFLHLLLNQHTLYRVSEDVTHQKIFITLENTRLLTSLPDINYDKTSIRHIKMVNLKNANLMIEIELVDKTFLQALTYDETAKLPELQIQFYHDEPLESQPVFIKKVALNLTDEQLLQQAMSEAGEGHSKEAIRQLAVLVTQSPANNLARLNLINLLLKQGDSKSAENYLTMGLQQNPDYLPFVELKAKILVDKNQITRALALLESRSPSINQHLNYYSFIAALYLQQGQNDVAVKIYERLLTQDPNRSVWWMGLALGLDNLGRHAEAMQAYEHADQGNQLNSEVRAFIEKKNWS